MERFDYIPADSSAGLVIYDKFAYSHHATDRWQATPSSCSAAQVGDLSDNLSKPGDLAVNDERKAATGGGAQNRR